MVGLLSCSMISELSKTVNIVSKFSDLRPEIVEFSANVIPCKTTF
jgi:hypothetical protein